MHEPSAPNDIRPQRVLRQRSRHRDDDVSCNRCYTAVGDERRFRSVEEFRRVSPVAFDAENFTKPQPAGTERDVSVVVRFPDERVRRVAAVRPRHKRFQLPLTRGTLRRAYGDERGSRERALQNYLTTSPRNTPAHGDTVTSPAVSDAGFARPSPFPRSSSGLAQPDRERT